ncbi:hypothetical protein J6590_027864 [Homalodisca vitripennis]|nr:hypothetical protein J6590_027864 [Homalodisca vitripennis]
MRGDDVGREPHRLVTIRKFGEEVDVNVGVEEIKGVAVAGGGVFQVGICIREVRRGIEMDACTRALELKCWATGGAKVLSQLFSQVLATQSNCRHLQHSRSK